MEASFGWAMRATLSCSAIREAILTYHVYKVIMAHCFTCGETKIWQDIEKSQNIMKLIVNIPRYSAILHLDFFSSYSFF